MKEATKILIADDEPLARDRLARIIERIDGYEVCGLARNGQQAVEIARTEYPDIALLDIRMPEMDGIEAAKHITKLEPPPAIIFCTAYDEYALQAFQANAIGYVLKPAREEQLLQSLNQAQALSQAHLKAVKVLQAGQSADSFFIANTWDGQEKIDLDDILLFKADQKYVNVIHKQGETLSNQTLKELEELYPHFIRVHRSTLVNTKHLRKLKKSASGTHIIELSNGLTTEVSRRHCSEVRDLISSL
ncbi:hypothetical protein A3715_03825 [Oleiphilus sp. HI0009]|nr:MULTISPECIES: LytTR family DNA-binding domain-containing protein [unclassified Oleiphilus]KZX85461.1 hypothetical protein A3715_03825 [Oleiphilus sp. HI0009]MCH2158285.1 LytTR family DNA-binding domain-containing protein [Oleiphilaceae bacterium]KZY64115.1 hypothetical protein A3738_11150 [Oleiphilus sp. HI0066]KZY69894.1 hypothetical protein A3739_07605 [Oleiphilus sp. HI0067]KZY70473.1 hypothetical protein A3739_17930 [Oleiphilus sp. HI0067]